MRYLLPLLIVVGCSPELDNADAGSEDSPDDGPQFTCVSGTAFCAMGAVWTCTLESHDAALTDSCVRTVTETNAMQVGQCVVADGGDPTCNYPSP